MKILQMLWDHFIEGATGLSHSTKSLSPQEKLGNVICFRDIAVKWLSMEELL